MQRKKNKKQKTRVIGLYLSLCPHALANLEPSGLTLLGLSQQSAHFPIFSFEVIIPN